MNMTLAGLTTREEVAMGMLVGKTLPGWKCAAVPAGRGVSLPPSDLYVVDLAGRGLARWTETAQSELLKALSAQACGSGTGQPRSADASGVAPQAASARQKAHASCTGGARSCRAGRVRKPFRA